MALLYVDSFFPELGAHVTPETSSEQPRSRLNYHARSWKKPSFKAASASYEYMSQTDRQQHNQHHNSFLTRSIYYHFAAAAIGLFS